MSPDTWRILCRGPVPQTVLDAYTPGQTQQLNSTDFTDTTKPPSGWPCGTVAKSLTLPVATSTVIWGSPYTGLVFAGPGTLFDAQTQTTLSNYLDSGGRLLLSGQDVLYSLSNNGTTQNNTFMQNELRATFDHETNPTVLTVNPAFPITFVGGDFDNLHIPVNGVTTDTYCDAAINRRLVGGMDVMKPLTGTSPVASSTTVFNAYTTGEGVLGQYIKQNRKSNGLESRVAFFGFGYEQIDRRYTNDASKPKNLNIRWRVCRNLVDKFFTTSGITGVVVDAGTNKPIPNFLVEADYTPTAGTGQPQKFLALTDANGVYSLIGLPPTLPSESYLVKPAVDNNGNSWNPLYRGGTPVPLNGNVFGTNVPTANFRVFPVTPGSISGTVVSSNGTPSDRTDDTPIPNVPVLVKSLVPLQNACSTTNNGGKFARLVATDAFGHFTVDNVPANVPLRVILNPNEYLETEVVPPNISADSNGMGDIPVGSGINYGRLGTNPILQQRTDLRTRRLPDSIRPALIEAIEGDAFILNDNDPVDPTDPTGKLDNGLPLLLPKGPSVGGIVTLNGTPVAGATVVVSITGEPAPRTQVTDSTGHYLFLDVPVGTWTFTATAPLPYRGQPGNTVSIQVTIANANQVDVGTANIALFKQDVTGSVTINHVLTAGFQVTLLVNGIPVPSTTTPGSPPGAIASPNPTTTSAAGTYSFTNVAPGTYTVSVSKGALIGTSAPFTVVQGVDAVAPTVNFTTRSLTGTVWLNTTTPDASALSVGGAPNAEVDLFDASGNLLTSTQTNGNGVYTFADVQVLGGVSTKYFVQAKFGGDVTPRAPVTLTAAPSTVQDLNVYQETIYGFLFTRTSQNATPVPQPNTFVTLLKGTTVVTSVRTDSSGKFIFSGLVAPDGAPQTYTLSASNSRRHCDGHGHHFAADDQDVAAAADESTTDGGGRVNAG